MPKPASILQARMLPDTHIEMHEEASSMQALFEAVARKVAGRDRPQPAHVFRALWRRHASNSPSLGTGLALARAAVPKIARPLAVYQRLLKPMKLLPSDTCRTTDCLTLLVPRPGLMADHELLIAVSDYLAQETEVQHLLACTSASDLRFLLTGQT